MNVLSTFGVFFGNTNRDVSDNYKTRITPAGFAFAIWGLIYFFQACFVVWSLLPQQKNNNLIFHGVSWFFVLSCVLNGIWVLVFAINTDIAVQICAFILFLVLGSALIIYVRTNAWLRINNTWPEFLFIDVAISLYAGWLTLASILNVSIAIIASGVTDTLWDVSADTWGCVMLGVALFINVLIVLTRQDFVFPLVLAWATNAIRVESEVYEIQLTALIVAIAGLVIALLTLFYRVFVYYRRTNNGTSISKDTSPPVQGSAEKSIQYS